MYDSVYERCSWLNVRVSSSVYLWRRLTVFRYSSLFMCLSVFSVHYHFPFIRGIGYKLSIISRYISDPLRRFHCIPKLSNASKLCFCPLVFLSVTLPGSLMQVRIILNCCCGERKNPFGIR